MLWDREGRGQEQVEPVRWCGAGEGLFDLETGKPVRLATMHLDGDSMNNEEWNLVTACRPCHATYDQPEIVAGRNTDRRWKHIEAVQRELFPGLL